MQYAFLLLYMDNEKCVSELNYRIKTVIILRQIVSLYFVLVSLSLYDENYAISFEKQSTCGEKYRDILRNIAIFQKYRTIF